MSPTPSAINPRAAQKHLAAADPKFGALIERLGPLDSHWATHRTGDTFQYLFRAIVGQQLSGKAAATIHARAVAALPGSPAEPTPAAVVKTSDAVLRSAGLSAAKLAAIRDLAARTDRGELPHMDDMAALSDDDILARVTAVRGVGPWTAQMLLMFRLGRPDVLPTGDLGVRKGFEIAFGVRAAQKARDGLVKPEVIVRRAEAWRPHRTVACWYLWQACDA
jgi:DNA-3-methyladenine glycosylase II